MLVARTLLCITPTVALQMAIGMDGMMSRATLPYTRDDMTPGIRILIKLAAMGMLMLFPAKIHTVMY